jgi:phosphopantetheinyl transferase (holo-ACP synthase)
MIYGVGTDIINIERVEQILNKNKDERLTKRGLVNTLTRGCSLNHTGVFGARKLCRIRL